MTEEIHILISKYFSGQLSEDEKISFDSWLLEHPDNSKIIDDYHLLWEQTEGSKLHIDVEKALVETKRSIGFINKRRFVTYLQSAAAVLITSVLISSAYLYFFQDIKTEEAEYSPFYQEITTAYGTRSKFLLPDSTAVWLNSGSKLIFPTTFKGETRDVKLTGEAFFEVMPNSDFPFIVKTSGVDIRVLGTAFDVQAYENSNEVATTLAHGKVLLEKNIAGEITTLTELMPNERAVFDLEDKAIRITKEEDVDKYIAWKDGKLVFFNDPIELVANKLGNWYNVDVKIKSENLKGFRFTATFTDEPVEQVLNLLSKSSPIHYEIIKASRQSDNSYTKRIVILK